MAVILSFSDTASLSMKHEIHKNNIKVQFVPHRKHFVTITATNRLRLFKGGGGESLFIVRTAHSPPSGAEIKNDGVISPLPNTPS
jgi:hypothetical protein